MPRTLSALLQLNHDASLQFLLGSICRLRKTVVISWVADTSYSWINVNTFPIHGFHAIRLAHTTSKNRCCHSTNGVVNVVQTKLWTSAMQIVVKLAVLLSVQSISWIDYDVQYEFSPKGVVTDFDCWGRIDGRVFVSNVKRVAIQDDTWNTLVPECKDASSTMLIQTLRHVIESLLWTSWCRAECSVR